MAIPKAVQEQGKQADQLAQEFLKQKEQAANADAAPAPVEDTPAPVRQQDKPKESVTDENSAEHWKKRFTGLKQTHDETVSGLRQTIAGQNQRISEMERQIQALSAAKPAPEAAKPDKVDVGDVLSVLTDKEREEFDAGYVDMIARIAQRIASKSTGEAVNQVKSRVDAIESVAAVSQQRQFWQAIDDPVEGFPEWEKLNAMDEFKNWAFGRDPLTGKIRQDIINSAQETLNPEPIIALYRQFQDTVMPRLNSKPKDPRETLVTPEPGAGGGDGGDVVEVPTFRESFVTQFYSDLNKGKYKNRPDEAKRIMAQIDAATRAGKILPG